MLLILLVSAASCTRRVYWPQSHNSQAAVPRGAVRITVLEEGRDYQGWSPAPLKCQQRPFPLHVTKR